MIRTKHAFVFVVVLTVVLMISLVWAMVFLDGKSKDAFIEDEAIFVEETNEYGVVSDDGENKDEIRESLLSKLEEGSLTREEEGEQEIEIEDESLGILLGDGKLSTRPMVGSIYTCQNSFQGVGAQNEGEWIKDDYWYPDEKVYVDGAASWFPQTTISTPEGARLIKTNGLPNHTTGVYPISPTDDAYQYDRNPNSISAQDITLQLPLIPRLAVSPSCLPMGMIGVGLNGVAIFNGLDAAGQDAPAHEIQDSCGGHPEMGGQYHYHNESECLLSNVSQSSESTLVGYALDGFGIYSSVESGVKIVNEDLDSCHGHQHTIVWDGEPMHMYHYHMTDEYPYTLGCFMGEPVELNREDISAPQTMPLPGPDFPSPPPGLY